MRGFLSLAPRVINARKQMFMLKAVGFVELNRCCSCSNKKKQHKSLPSRQPPHHDLVDHSIHSCTVAACLTTSLFHFISGASRT